MAKSLGRGLGAILEDVQESYVKDISRFSDSIQEIDIVKIIPNPYQPRKIFNEDKLKELANSIKQQGLIQPIVVVKDEEDYILIVGERRLRACKLLKKTKIKALVINFDLTKLREYAIIENLQREDLNVLDLAKSIYELIEEHNYTHEEVGKILSKSRSYISNLLRILKLSNYVKEKITNNEINFGQAKNLVNLDEKSQKKITDKIIKEKLSAREVEHLVKNYKNNMEKIDLKVKYKNNNFGIVVELIREKYLLNIRKTNNSLVISVTSKKDLKKIKKIFDI